MPSFALFPLAAVALLAAGVGTAFAQGSTSVDLSPLISLGIEFAAPLAGALGTVLGVYLVGRLMKLVGLQVDARQREAVDQALRNAIAFGLAKVRDRLDDGKPIAVDLRSEAMAAAARYAQDTVPGALKHFNITAEGLADRLETRLEAYLTAPRS